MCMVVCVLAMNLTPLKYDSRILKETASLLRAGHSIHMIKIHYKNDFLPPPLSTSILHQIRLVSRKLPSRNIFWIIKYTEFVCKSICFLLSIRANIYHAHDLNTLLPATIASFFTKVRVIYDSHELYTERPIEFTFFWRIIERFLIKRVSAVIAANSERAEIMFHEYGARSMPTVIMNTPEKNVYSLSDFKINVRSFLPEQRRRLPLLLYHGALSPSRGLDSIVRALPLLFQPVNLVFVGNPYSFFSSYLFPLASKNNVENMVFHLKPVPNEKLISFIHGADVGIVIYKNTCRNNYLCAPNKLFEYAMAGIPIVACNYPPILNLSNQFNGIQIFDPENALSIAKAICQIIDADEITRQSLLEGLKFISSRYNWTRDEKTLLDLYSSLTDR